MRNVKYRVLAPVGSGSEQWEGPCTDLVEATPYLLIFDTIPPFHILNAALRTGDGDAGMSGGCMWEPFELTAAEYEELAEHLRRKGYHSVEPAEWVEDSHDWLIYLDEVYNKVPSDLMREYQRRIEELEEAERTARAAGDYQLVGELAVQLARLYFEKTDKRREHLRNYDGGREVK